MNNINASFEVSLFKFSKPLVKASWCSLFKENVSLHAIEFIKNELWVDFVRGNVDLSGCVLRKTHGLPCAHEIWVTLKTRKAIPATKVHQHWQKLSLDELLEGSFAKTRGYDTHVLFGMFMAKYESETEERKQEMLHRLKEVIHPNTTNLKEPPINKNPKGRPRGNQGKKFTAQNDEDSTKRDPSYWEHVLAATSQASSVNNVKEPQEQ